MPAIFPEVTLKYLRFSTSASATAFRRRPDVGPCSARAATCSETSSIFTSRPRAFWWNHRRLGSAAVQRYVFSWRRETVPSSIVLPCSSHQGVYTTEPTPIFRTSRVMMRSTRRVASLPDSRYLNRGEMSISAAALRIALYSCSWCASYALTA